MPDAPEVDDIIGSSEAAEILGVSAREVRRKASEGVLPAFRVEGAVREEWRFYRTDVEDYQRDRDEGGSDGRTDMATVRTIDRLAAAQERNTEAAEALADRLGDLGDLKDTLAAGAEAQADATGAVRDLVETIQKQQEEIARLREDLQAERKQRALEQQRSWLDRLLGRTGSE